MLDTNTLIERASNRDPVFWTMANIRLPGNRKWDFAKRPWLIDIYRSVNFDEIKNGTSSREMVIRKCTQVGLTTMALTRVLEFASRFYGVTSGYYLPRQDDVRDLVTTRLDPIISESSTLGNLLTQLDSTRTKQFRTGSLASFIHFMEASVMPRMLPLDMVVGDEFDLCNQEHMEMVKNRLDASSWKIEFFFSTPTLPNYGVDKLFKERSDARQWAVKCPFCGKYQVLDWDSHLRVRGERVYLGCLFCDKGNDEGFNTESILKGQWVAEFPERKIPGFWISQLMTPWISLEKLYKEFKETKPTTFYNLRLGLPYSPGLGGLTFDEICNALTPQENFSFQMNALSSQEICMGVDQGDEVYIIAGSPDRKIIFSEIISLEDAENRIASLVDNLNIKRLVIDALPNKLLSTHLVRRFPSIVWMSFYTDSATSTQTFNWDKENHAVYINRTDSFDNLILEEVGKGKWSFWTEGPISERNVIALHLSNIKRENVVRKTVMGEKEMGVWRRSGPDHFAHALGYLRAAIAESEFSKSLRCKVIAGTSQKKSLPEQTGYTIYSPMSRDVVGGSFGHIRVH